MSNLYPAWICTQPTCMASQPAFWTIISWWRWWVRWKEENPWGGGLKLRVTHFSSFVVNRGAYQHPRQGAGALPAQPGGEVQRSCQVCYTNMHTDNRLGNLCWALPWEQDWILKKKYSLNFKRNEYFGRMHKNKYRLKYIGPIFKNVIAIYFFKEYKVKIKEENRPHNEEHWPGKTFPEHYSLQDRLPFKPDLIKQCLVTQRIFSTLCRLTNNFIAY